MNASTVLEGLHRRGVKLRAAGDRLRWRAPAGVISHADVEALRVHKETILSLLRPAPDLWTQADWQVFFDERAGIVEFDGGLSRPEAEARAFACCVAEMMNRTLVVSDPDRCVYCGGDDRSGDRLLPFVATTTGHTWLHPACWESWFRGQQGDAAAALAAMGIGPAREGSR